MKNAEHWNISQQIRCVVKVSILQVLYMFFVLALELCTRRRELADGKVGTPTYASWQYKHWFPSIFTSSNQRYQ